jgi:hypothetical protein
MPRNTQYRSIKSILKNALDLAPCHSLVALPDGGQMQIFETLRKICFDVGGLSHCNVPG